MKRLLRRMAVVFLAAAVILCLACTENRNYSGFELGNSAEISEALRSAMLNRSYRLRVSFQAETMSSGDVEKITEKLIEDAFYESKDPCGGDYLRYQYGGYELRYSVEESFLKYKYQLKIIPDYYTTSAQEAKVDERVIEIISGFSLDEDASDYEKIRCVSDFIADNVDYDTVHRHMAGSRHMQSTAYGALFYHTALCQGYAVLCYRMLKEMGIDVRIVTGTAYVSGEAERHAWNLVRLDGEYYNLDITLDDVNGTQDYFLKTDADLAADHLRDEEYMTEEFYQAYPMAKENYVSDSI